MSAYTEDHLIEQPAIQLMEHELGWDSLNAYDEPPSPPTSPRLRGPGRLRRSGWSNEVQDPGEVVLPRPLKLAQPGELLHHPVKWPKKVKTGGYSRFLALSRYREKAKIVKTRLSFMKSSVFMTP
jgi:hypothetical protein